MRSYSPAESIFFTTVRILANTRGATLAGTGFFVSRKLPSGHELFVVTARHVVEDALNGDFYFLPAIGDELTLGTPVPFRWKRGIWVYHPDDNIDIAVLPVKTIEQSVLSLGERVAMLHFPESDFVPKWERSEHPLIEVVRRPQPLSEVLILGYPSNYFDHTNGLPIARRGLTASPLSIEFENRPVFLVDAEIVPGSSGSPVFYVEDSNNPTQFKLLGVVSRTLRWKPLDWFPHPDDPERHLIHLGAVYRAHTVSEAIDHVLQSAG